MKNLFLTFLLLFSTTIGLKAQNLVYKVDFGVLFDNLEGSADYTPTRTLFTAKFAPEIGVKFAEKHQFMVGAVMLQNLGDNNFLTDADYTIYYNFSDANFNVYAGSFPRANSIATYPNSFFREDFLFTDNNIEGVMAQYVPNKGNGYIEVYVDWYGQNQENRDDEFLFAGSTEFSYCDKLFFFGANALVNHIKNTDLLVDSYLYERAFYNVYVGTDLQSLMPCLDRFRINFGTNSSLEHKRFDESVEEEPWANNLGWQFGFDINWKGAGLKNDFYFGDSQLMYYEQYENDLYWGNQFYQSDRYNLTELYYEKSWGIVSLKAAMKFHITPDVFANQQLLTLKLNLNQMIKNGKLVNVR
ncbi:MAG: hypothetical protein R3Y51_02025 [Rikenellaceae bacterium]